MCLVWRAGGRQRGDFSLDLSHFHNQGLFKTYRLKTVRQDRGCTYALMGPGAVVRSFLVCRNSVGCISAAAVDSHLNVYCTLKSRTLPESLQVDTFGCGDD